MFKKRHGVALTAASIILSLASTASAQRATPVAVTNDPVRIPV